MFNPRDLTSAIFAAGVNFLYPRACIWCRSLISEHSPANQRFCPSCLQKIAPLIPDRCLRCSAPVGPNLKTENGCIHCNREPVRYRRVISLGPYVNEMRLACLRCKRPRQTGLTIALANLMFERSKEQLQEMQADIVLPVPHHWTDRLLRDHAAATIGEQLARSLKLPCGQHCLIKSRRTRKQQKLSASARRPNLRGAFKITRRRAIVGKRILLADDILTTGITADRCASALLDAGAAEVNVAVLARSIGG